MKYGNSIAVRLINISAYTSTALTTVFTSILLYAIATRTPEEMRHYRVLLLNYTIASLILSLLFSLCEPVPSSSLREVNRPANDSGISYVIYGPIVYFIEPFYNQILSAILVGVLLYTIMAIPLSFVFRYFAVRSKRYMEWFASLKVLFPIFMLNALIGSIAALFMCVGNMPKDEDDEDTTKISSWSHYYTYYGDNPNIPLFGNLIHLNSNVYYTILIFGICLFISYATVITFSMLTFKAITSLRSISSKQSLDAQRHFLVLLIFQSMLPAIFLVIPITVVVITIACGMLSTTINGTAIGLMFYETVFSVLIDLFGIVPYRKMLFSKFTSIATLKERTAWSSVINH
uniref:Seven TM Receptor n=1 Tax=Ascaris lumbricoides TaxID=6252 RepID=A0A0M3IH37_ASCLU